MEFRTKIGRRGRDLAFRLPAAVVRQFDVHAGDPFEIAVDNGRIVITFGRSAPVAKPSS